MSIIKYNLGVLSDSDIKRLIDKKNIFSQKKINQKQIQPASIDLSVSRDVWRVKSSFLPSSNNTVENKIDRLSMHKIDLKEGAVLEKGCVYIAKINESLNLPHNISATANPKSSTGRLDIFTRLITDYAMEFENVPLGYSGPLYLEISPRTFSVLLKENVCLNQIRFKCGVKTLNDEETKSLQNRKGLIIGALGELNIKDGVPLSVNLSGDDKGLIGYKARKHTDLIDVEKISFYNVEDYWEDVTIRDLSSGGLILNPDEFYILASREYVSIPEKYAAEMRAYDTRVGEFRAHYAGFFDPGFGMASLGASPTRAVLEVRSHEVPFLIEEGQTVCRLFFEPMSSQPKQLYGIQGSGSNYQSQGLKLSKNFNFNR